MMQNVGLEELREKALMATRWEIRNLAVKELGRRKSEEGAKAALLEVISDRRPSVWWRKLLGDGLFQVGFTRRNAWMSLAEHKPSLEEVEPHLNFGFEDPYYEVKTATWNLLTVTLREDNVKLPEPLRKNLCQRMRHEEDFEILTAALGVVDRVCDKEVILNWASMVDRFKHWRVRAAYLEAMERCCERGVLEREEIEPLLKQFNLRSEYFRPVFMLKEHGSRLERSLQVEA